jgi:hypothetical protein
VKDPYREALEFFTFSELVDALEAISDETLRLEFKEVIIPKTQLAHLACAFANAEGGIIVIGIKDPARYGVPFEFEPLAQVDDSARLRLLGQINSRVYPPIPSLEAQGYKSHDGDKSILLIRIPRSDVTPHECRCGEGPNLPVRRGTSIDKLSLGEIELLQLRRINSVTESPLRQRRMSLVQTGPASGRGLWVGLSVVPAVYLRKRRIMDHADDLFCCDCVEQTRGPDSEIHGEFQMVGSPDTNYFFTKDWKRPEVAMATSGYGPDYSGPPQSMEIYSDGEIVIRLGLAEEDPFKRFVYTLLMGYAVAQDVFYRFGISPEARVHVYASFGDHRNSGVGPVPDLYEDWFELNLAVDSFADGFLDTAMRLNRAADRSADRSIIRGILEDYSREVLPRGDRLRENWLNSGG